MTVKACGVEVCSGASVHTVTPMAPNMCITPAAPSPLPMPYPLVGTTASLDPGCSNTKIMGKKSLNTKGKTARVNGNEPGTQKDVVTFCTTGKAFALMGVPVVMFEGAMVAVTGSPGFGNTR